MQFVLNNVRLSFPSLFKPSRFSEDQDAKFSATLIVPKDHPQLAALQKAIAQVVKDKWPAGKPGGLKVFLRDGAEKSHLDGFGDQVMFATASSTRRPAIVDRRLDPVVEGDPQAPYPGCYVNVTLEVWPQDNQYGKRINASLRAVQFYQHGDSFGGGGAPVDVAQVFKSYEEDEEDDFLGTGKAA